MRRRILIVDDEAVDRETIRRLIEAQGHIVEVAADAGEAYAVGDRFRPDIILLDIRMLPLDGYETCAHFRQEPWGKAAMIFAITGNRQFEDPQQAQHVGFDGLLHKPLDAETLSRLLG